MSRREKSLAHLLDVEYFRCDDVAAVVEPEPCARVLDREPEHESAARVGAHNVMHLPHHRPQTLLTGGLEI